MQPPSPNAPMAFDLDWGRSASRCQWKGNHLLVKPVFHGFPSVLWAAPRLETVDSMFRQTTNQPRNVWKSLESHSSQNFRNHYLNTRSTSWKLVPKPTPAPWSSAKVPPSISSSLVNLSLSFRSFMQSTWSKLVHPTTKNRLKPSSWWLRGGGGGGGERGTPPGLHPTSRGSSGIHQSVFHSNPCHTAQHVPITPDPNQPQKSSCQVAGWPPSSLWSASTRVPCFAASWPPLVAPRQLLVVSIPGMEDMACLRPVSSMGIVWLGVRGPQRIWWRLCVATS